MKKSYWSGFLCGVLCTVLFALVGVNVHQFAVNRSAANESRTETAEHEDSKISTINVLTKVSLLQKYIDIYYLNEVKGENLEDGIYKGIVKGLHDPYSVYYTKNEFTSLQESTNGVYCGIGASVMQDPDTGAVSIVQPFAGGPAEKAGVLPNDIIYKIDGKEVIGKDLSQVVAMMKGEKGSKVDFTLLREKKEIDLTLVRDEIEVPTVAHKMLDDNIGYIKVSEFDEVTAKQFRKALDGLEADNEKGLIIDLRNNGGGRLSAVVDMLDRMLPEGVIVSTKEKSGEGETYSSTDKEKFEKPLVVLINGNSASASEVFAGAIQDYGTGKLVGTTSFGKGIVQTIFGLKDGTAVKLTTSEYFTPKGRNIHGRGLTPDVTVELKEGLQQKINIDQNEDNQLQTAITTVKEAIK